MATIDPNEGSHHAVPPANKSCEEAYSDTDSPDDTFFFNLLDEPAEETSVADNDCSPAIRTLNEVLHDAVQLGASSVHFQPEKESLLVRYRIDGVMSLARTLPKRIERAMLGRIKVVAGMDIAERRRPQNGVFSLVDQVRLLFCAATAPTLHGERITLRIRCPDETRRSLYALDLEPHVEQMLQQWISRRQGMIFVTGPTDSGVTTTLYALIEAANVAEKNVLTLEAPIEHELPGVSQMEIAPATGNNLSLLLSHARRHEADVVMCTDLHGAESIRQAVDLALTGTLVVTGMHTPDVVSTITRLFDAEIEPGLIAAVMSGIVSQRLVRRICDSCRAAYRPDDDELRSLELTRDQLQDGVLWRGQGCLHCRHRGYLGRLAVHEVWDVGDVSWEKFRDASYARLKEEARRSGLHTFRADGQAKLLCGLTTVEEMLRVLPKN